MPSDPAPAGDAAADNIRYRKQPAPPAALQALAGLAPTLKEGELRLATALAALTERTQDHAIRISTRKLCKLTKLATSALDRAIKGLAARCLITVRHGTTTSQSAYMVNFLTTIRASFGEAPPASTQEAPVLLFEKHPAPFAEAPLTENKGLTGGPAAVDIDRTSIELLDRVLTANKSRYDKRDLDTLREWVDGYWTKLGPTQPNPHPVDDKILAQLLAVAPLEQLIHLLKDLFTERKRPEISAAWFVVVALQRIHGIHPEALKVRRADLRAVRRPQAPEPTQDNLGFAENLIGDLAKAKGMAGR